MRSFFEGPPCASVRLAGFRQDQSGNVAIVMALIAVVMMLSVGAAVDLGRWLHARDQTVSAVDAAVLAGGRALQTNNKDQAAAVAAAQKYYTQNVTSRLPIVNDTVSFAVAPDGMGVVASGSAYIKTPFLQFAAIDKLPLISNSQTQFSKSQIQVGGNGGENIEVALMLDVTGSMCNSAPSRTQKPCTSGRKIDAMKKAAKDLIGIVVWQDQSKFTSKMSIVPFSDSVRLSSSAVGKAWGGPTPDMTVTKTAGSGWGASTYYYNRTSNCVVERGGSKRYEDVAPSSGNYSLPVRWSVDASKKSQVAECTLDAASEILPLTSDKDTLLAKVDTLTGKGGTAGQVGTAWSWYTLSPNWSSVLNSSSAPAAYGTSNLRKIAILMTDGEYNTQYDASGINTNDPGAGTAVNGSSATQAKELCKAMKKKTALSDPNITIYTVGFEVGNNASALDVLTTCASDPGKYYDAQDEDELQQAFRDIALKLSSLYISK
jgi:Flp pilus assembly protein TadG